MKNKKILFAVLAIALVLGMTACPSDSGGGGTTPPPPNTDPKTLVITGITGLNGYGSVGILEKGTTPEQIAAETGYVAGAAYTNPDYTRSGTTLNIALYNPGTNSGRWTGNGTYDIGIYLMIGSDPVAGYIAKNIAFSTATTTVTWDKFTKYEE